MTASRELAYPRIDFDLSPVFWALCLDGEPDSRNEEHRALVNRLLPGATGERKAEALAAFSDVAADYETAGVVYAANLLGRVGDRLTIGHFTITLEPFEETDPRAAAHAVARSLHDEPGRTRAVKLVRLPCGPAVATEELRAMDRFPFGQAQVFVKPPACPGLVVLTMVTPTADDLPGYTGELAAIAESLRFVY